MHLILIKWNVLLFKFMPSMIYSGIEYLFINLGKKNFNLGGTQLKKNSYG